MSDGCTAPTSTEGQRADVLSAMSIDVEEWFHVENVRRVLPPERWPEQTSRVEASVDRMLELLEATDARATFFVLGLVAEKAPALVARIAEAGHEVASHGYGHEILARLTPEAFRTDVTRTKELLEDITGREILGYRAPNFSITQWALEILAETGHRYDSSYVPTSIDNGRIGKLAPDAAASAGIHEVPLPCLAIGGRAVPWGGGGYFRLLPYPVFRRGMRHIQRSSAYVFYLHPWELDPGHPLCSGLTFSERFRHTVNLSRMEQRWRSLLEDFRWGTIAETFLSPSSPAVRPGAAVVAA